MIEAKLEILRRYFSLENIVAINFSTEDTSLYYHINRRTYSIFHSKKFTHMGISKNDGKLRKDDLKKPSKIINTEIQAKNAKNILELACWRWGTLEILSRDNSSLQFLWVDYSKTQLSFCPKRDNITYTQWDYHLLDFPNKSFDVVYIIEALCYSTDKKKVFSEVQRVLRPWWVFVVIDGHSTKEKEEMTDYEKLAFTLASKWMAVQDFESYNAVKNYAQNAGLEVYKEIDVSDNILPTTNRFERMASYFLKWWLLAKLFIKIMPTYFSMNIISWYLISDLIREDIASYWITYFRK